MIGFTRNFAILSILNDFEVDDFDLIHSKIPLNDLSPIEYYQKESSNFLHQLSSASDTWQTKQNIYKEPLKCRDRDWNDFLFDIDIRHGMHGSRIMITDPYIIIQSSNNHIGKLLCNLGFVYQLEFAGVFDELPPNVTDAENLYIDNNHEWPISEE